MFSRLTTSDIMFMLLTTTSVVHNTNDSHCHYAFSCRLEHNIYRKVVGIFMTYLHTSFHLPNSSGSFVTTIKLKYRYGFHAAAILLPYILQNKYQQKLHIFQSCHHSGPYIRCNYRVEPGYISSTVALRVVGRRRRNGNPVPGGITGRPCHCGTWIQGHSPLGLGLHVRLTTLFYKKNIVMISRVVNPGRNLAQSSNKFMAPKGLFSQMMMMMMMILCDTSATHTSQVRIVVILGCI
jgi:hypothetical protein